MDMTDGAHHRDALHAAHRAATDVLPVAGGPSEEGELSTVAAVFGPHVSDRTLDRRQLERTGQGTITLGDVPGPDSTFE